MVNIHRAEQFPVAADTLFSLFASAEGRMQIMKDYVSKIEVEGKGAAAIYKMYTSGMLPEGCVVERTELFDSLDRRLEVNMTDTGGVVPFADYRAGIRVQDAGRDASVLVLFSSFVPIGMSDKEGEAAANLNYDSVFKTLHEMFRAN